MKYRGYIVVAAAVVMQTCLGGIYAWSLFVDSLKKAAGFSNTQTQFVFGMYIFINTAVMLLTGRIQDRRGPRALCIISGILIGFSYLAAGYFGDSFGVLMLSIGVIGGLANGCGYICTIPACAKWFPTHKGLVCGLAVAGYGAGGIVLSAIAKGMMARGYDAFGVFRVVGMIYGPAVIICGSLIINPPGMERSHHEHIRFGALLSDKKFWRLALGIFCATVSGIIIVGNLKPLGTWLGRGSMVAVSAIGMFAIGSASGRILWGFIYDRLGGKRTIIILFLCTIASPMAMLAGKYSDAAFLTASLIAGFCYGGCFPVYSAQSAKLYGLQVFGSVYPLILLAHGVAAQISPPVAGKIFDKTGSFFGGLIFASITVTIGLCIYLYLRRGIKPK